MQKVTVSQEASDSKHNLPMPEKMGFLAPKRNSLSVISSEWIHLFLSQLQVGTHGLTKARSFSSALCLLVAASILNVSTEQRDTSWLLKLTICQKGFHGILQTPWLLVLENISPTTK